METVWQAGGGEEEVGGGAGPGVGSLGLKLEAGVVGSSHGGGGEHGSALKSAWCE